MCKKKKDEGKKNKGETEQMKSFRFTFHIFHFCSPYNNFFSCDIPRRKISDEKKSWGEEEEEMVCGKLNESEKKIYF